MMNEVMKMNPRNVNFSNECAFNSREYHFAKRRNEVKRLMACGYTKKRAQQLAKKNGY
jgi:hypothetical protein